MNKVLWEKNVGNFSKNIEPGYQSSLVKLSQEGSYWTSVLESYGLYRDCSILDIGCGNGMLPAFLLEKHPQIQYDGIDVSQEAVDFCNAHCASENARFQHTDVTNSYYTNQNSEYSSKNFKLPFADDSFDFVILLSVFTHMWLEDIEAYINQIHRVLKKNGVCMATFYTTPGKVDTEPDPMQHHRPAPDQPRSYDYWTCHNRPPLAKIGYRIPDILAIYQKKNFEKISLFHEWNLKNGIEIPRGELFPHSPRLTPTQDCFIVRK